jgi:hypothetical protein
MQQFILIVTTVWLTGRDPGAQAAAQTSMQEFSSFQSCMTARQEVRRQIIAQADDYTFKPRVKAVCLPK